MATHAVKLASSEIKQNINQFEKKPGYKPFQSPPLSKNLKFIHKDELIRFSFKHVENRILFHLHLNYIPK